VLRQGRSASRLGGRAWDNQRRDVNAAGCPLNLAFETGQEPGAAHVRGCGRLGVDGLDKRGAVGVVLPGRGVLGSLVDYATITRAPFDDRVRLAAACGAAFCPVGGARGDVRFLGNDT